MRYHESIQMAEKFQARFPSLLSSLTKQDGLSQITTTTSKAIIDYLNYFYQDDDKDYATFDVYFYQHVAVKGENEDE